MLADPGYRNARRPRHGQRYLVAAVVAVLLLLVLGDLALIGAIAFLRKAEAEYDGRIYPNVYVQGLNLGGLAPVQAAAALRALPDPAAGAVLVLADGEKRWAISWPQAGVHRDLDATVRAAMAVGRDGAGLPARIAPWLVRHRVDPVFAVDPAAARQALEYVAAQVAIPPTEAGFRLEGERLVAVPGEVGRALDVEATLPILAGAVAAGDAQPTVELALRDVPPQVADATPLLPRAEELLARRVQLTAYDVVSDEAFSWTLDRAAMVGWLRVAADGAGLALEVDRAAVEKTLAGPAGELDGGRGLRLDDAPGRVLAALEAGGGEVPLYLTHPARSYSVQAGDVLDGIAARFGMPPAVLAEANPGIDPGWLTVGQELVVPSPDVLLPHMPVRGKRIVISLSRQRIWVYENGTVIYDWPVSTGIASSPTLTGVFQVLEKVENAYASQWNLWMPDFLAVYQAGPSFYNGIHALPILSGGGRLWDGLLGRPASYGCIILGIGEAETLYRWADVGVPVIIER